MEKMKIRSFTDLNARKEGHQLVLLIYKITSTFPKNKVYSLVDQMRRCVISITSNLAKSFSRRTKKKKIQFYYMSIGSVTELQNQLLIAKDLGYIKKEEFHEIAQKTITVHKLISGLVKTSQNVNL